MDKNKLSELLISANRARDNAYAPYSQYRVGCAILLKDGTVIKGINIENASYGATICAERSAMAPIVTAGLQDSIEALAVVTSSSPPGSPCGVCRQFLSEFLSLDTPIIMRNEKGESVLTNMAELLPMAFNREALRK